MSRKRRRQLPGYLLHKASGQARVVINGKDIWLGKHGTSESHDRYDEEISKVLEQTRLSETNISISEVLAAFWAFAKKRYGNTGKGRYGAAVSWRPIIRLLRERHGDDRPRDFGPLALRALIEEMPSHGWNRRYANDHIGRIKRTTAAAEKSKTAPWEFIWVIRSLDSKRSLIASSTCLKTGPATTHSVKKLHPRRDRVSDEAANSVGSD